MAAKKPSKVKQAASRMKAKMQASRTKKPAKSLVAKAKAAKKVEPVPKGYHAVTPALTLRGAGAAIEFYKRAFGAKELSRMPSPDGSAIWHAQLKIGDSILHVADEMPGSGVTAPSSSNPSPGELFLYMKDAEQLFNQAVGAGATVVMPMTDQFWGDRMGMVRDPFGYSWALAKRVKLMTPREMQEAGEAFAREQAAGGAGSDGGGQVASGPQAIPDQPTPNDLPSGAI